MTPDDLTLLRLRIVDTDTSEQLLTDVQLTSVYNAAAGPWSAAADALEMIAISEVLVGKKIRTQDLSTDGAAVSAELRQLAKGYRAKAAAAGEVDGEDPDIFMLADTVPARRSPELTEHEVWGL